VNKIKRTPDEIAAQIAGLKKEKERIPEFSSFGDKNWKKIDAQIAVLEGKRKPDFYYEDESAEEFIDGNNDVWSAACEAEDWLNYGREDLFDNE
jgi:hypothetical protein